MSCALKAQTLIRKVGDQRTTCQLRPPSSLSLQVYAQCECAKFNAWLNNRGMPRSRALRKRTWERRALAQVCTKDFQSADVPVRAVPCVAPAALRRFAPTLRTPQRNTLNNPR